LKGSRLVGTLNEGIWQLFEFSLHALDDVDLRGSSTLERVHTIVIDLRTSIDFLAAPFPFIANIVAVGPHKVRGTDIGCAS
jgi:hypothetical protein